MATASLMKRMRGVEFSVVAYRAPCPGNVCRLLLVLYGTAKAVTFVQPVEASPS
jgi:hypothetical protein